jgi:hypothetical protein
MTTKIYKSEEELLVEILNRLQEISDKMPTKNTANDSLGVIDNADLLRLLKITNRTAIKWRQQKKLPYFRIGGKIYYRIAEIEKMIEELYGKN